MAAGDMSFARGTTTCSCAKVATQAALRFWVGARLKQPSSYNAPIASFLYFLNYTVHVSAVPIVMIGSGSSGYYWAEATQNYEFSLDFETYGEVAITGNRPEAFQLRNGVPVSFGEAYASSFYWHDVAPAIAQITQGPGAYFFTATSAGQFVLSSFTAGESYSVELTESITIVTTSYTVTRTFTDWLSPARMFDLLTSDLRVKRTDLRTLIRGISVNGAWSDRAFQTVYIGPNQRAHFYEAFDTDWMADRFIGTPAGQLTNWGHAANHTLSLTRIAQGFFFGGSEPIGFPAFLMRSDILINGNHHIETFSQFGLPPAGSPLILACEDVSVACPLGTYPVEPPDVNDRVKGIFLNRLCGDLDRQVNFPAF